MELPGRNQLYHVIGMNDHSSFASFILHLACAKIIAAVVGDNNILRIGKG